MIAIFNSKHVHIERIMWQDLSDLVSRTLLAWSRELFSIATVVQIKIDEISYFYFVSEVIYPLCYIFRVCSKHIDIKRPEW